ncbi:type I polyketide synthase [Shewanella glacialipiscicola]|uniref:Type I polyketide synthase n=1 Tax=Shewanella glacialipiscicola TaxID=614069 RepID=A0ABQ6J6B1_9GAMM|nr:type I polyketide synthase [Shewanella glacialipiscicola]MCL1084909.1 phosphopantetheine-binding protein [Shewanella glacialipiscicola]GIU05604.1 type I polyketide synthase [Shewanella glacialipiscicola]GMA82774.1 type I polyketide synthase [Shewanella glacialipiscicola]
MSHTPSVPNSATESKKDKRLNKRLKDMPVAIVGMASIFANSRYLNKFWDLISEKIDAITDIPDTHWRAEDYYDADKSKADKSYCKRGGFLPEVDFNPMEFGLPPNILELTDTSQLLSLIVAKEVLADANLPTDYDRDRIGITLGVGGGQKISQSLNSRLQYPVLKKVFKSSGLSDEDSEMLIKKFQDQYIHWEENSFPGSLGNVIAGRIANRFDFGGMNCVVDAACAGSLAAMRMALTELTEGRSDMMITGGVCTDNSPSMYMSFSKTPAFTTNETIQPFDIDSKGMMIGEGIGMVALKRLEDAERDGDRIYAVIKGVGASSDGKFKSIYAPRPEGQAKALERAYDDAGFAPHSIGLIEAHGTGTAAGDVAEFNGLKSVFAQGNDTNQHIALGSVKSQVGHTKSTAGTAGVIKAALALHHKVLPATINVSKPNPKLNIESSPFYLNTETRPWFQRADATPRRAGVSSFGFGGTNFHLVLEEYKPEHSSGDKYRQRSVPQTLLFAAANKTALLSELKAALSQSNNAGKSDNTHLRHIALQYPLRVLANNDARLGFVAKDIAQLQAQLNQSIAHLESGHLETSASEAWQLPSGINYRSHALVAQNESKKVAALFAGQGSQYLNMGRELACHFPEMRQQVMASDKVFAHHDQTPLSSILYPIPAFDTDAIKAQEAALTNTLFAQSAIGALSMAQYSLLTQAGFAPDMVAGHSFGELSALCAAGVISSVDYVELAFARGHAMAQKPSDTASKAADTGTMYAIILKQKNDIDALNSCLAQFDGVKIANYNAPTQLVIAGGTEQTQLAAKAISELGFKAIALPVSGAFHTPLVGHAQKPFAKAIDKAKFSAPSIALYANGTGQLHPTDGKAIKAEFKQHMLQSVRFSEQLQAMYDAGARVFVEFGPKNILQKLVENTLGEHLNELCLVSMNPNPKGDSDSQLRLAAVQLAVAGVALTEIDPYQAVTSQEIGEREAPSAMNIKLTATNHISAATKAKMAKSLATGSVTSQVQYVDRIVETILEKEVEKIVEKEVVVEKIVEKVVEVEAIKVEKISQGIAQGLNNNAQQASAPLSLSTSSVSGDALTAFFSAQSQAAQLHQQFLAIPQQYGDTFTTLMTAQAQMASQGIAIPESLQRSMEMFHQHQAQTLQSHSDFMQLQSSSSQAALAMLNNAPINFTPAVAQPRPVAPAQTVPTPVAATTVAHNGAPVATQAVLTRPAVSTPVAPVAQTAPVAYAPAAPAVTVQVAPVLVAPAAPATSSLSAALVQQTMMAVVADKTGYPTEMLELGMDMEADLGIDSIKRVEILGTVQDELPSLPELSPEDLAECRTLGEIVDYMNSKLVAVGSVSATTVAQVTVIATTDNGLSAALVQQTMMAVVADKTGYPTEMLELSMDMEADLGIDSIKRVEILGTVQDELPSLPELNPEDLAECRTLGEIVDYMNSKLVAAGSVSSTTAAQVTVTATTNNGLSAALVQQTMMAVVADKTGYPTEMLELSMDMEADLGIDSIKRVEILGTVQDELPSLPELNPEDLAECRTLGEIVGYMNSKLPATVSVVVSPTAPTTPAANGLSAALVQQTMMAVVADKTGYPTEMLELSMDMEADLGIDSIKRVEILGTVQDELPGLPELNPEDLAECRTLGEIVGYMQSKLGQNTTANVVNVAVAAEPVIDLPPHDLPPHSEVVLKKLPAAAELTQKAAQLSAQQTLTRVFAKDACIIISDDGHNAGVLAEKLHAQGLTVAVVRSPESLVASASPLNSHIASFTLAAIDDASISAVINEIKRLGTVAGFIHLQPQHKTSANAKGLVLSSAAKASVEQAFLFAKHSQPLLTAATANSGSSFISVSRIDGGFGYLNHNLIANSELNQAALAGLTKTLSHEWPSVHCRALDIAPALDAKQLANAVIAELFATDKLLEVGICEDLTRVTLVAGKADTRHGAANLTSADKILVTGGAKGVTFECALSLAKRCKAHFILAGRSSQQAIPTWAQGKNNSELKAAAIAHIQSLGEKPTPKQVDALVWPVQSSLEIASALQAFTAVGASAEYLSLDVNNPDAIASTIVPITELSPITGIIHGAGILADKHIQDKTLDELARVYGTKVTGISNLLTALDLDKVKLIALFSSAAGFYGNSGQSDYAMSNDILNKAALQLAQQLPNAKVMSFDWGPWDGGMVNPALKKMFIDRGVYVIPLKAGAELFASQLLSNTGAQLLVGTDMQGSAPHDDTPNEVQETEGSNLKKPEADLTTDSSGPHALTDMLKLGTVKLQRTLDPKAMIFIEDHCINGNPVLPTVCAIQWMREAAFDVLKQPVKVQSYKLLKGIIFDTAVLQNGALESAAPTTLELELAPIALTDKAAKDTDECLNRQFSALISFEGRPQYQAILVVDDTAIDDLATDSKAKAFDAQSLMGLSAIATASSLYSDGTLFHGPRLQGIESVVKFDDASLVAKVSLPHVALADCGSFVPNLTSKGSQAFAEDLLLQAMLVWARLKYGAASLPSSIGEFISHAPFAFGDKGYLVLEVVKHSGRALEAHIALYHQDGRLSCEMNNAKVTVSKSLNNAFLANKVVVAKNVEAKVG